MSEFFSFIFDNIVIISIVIGVLFVALIIILSYIGEKNWQKRKQEIMNEFNLTEGCSYNVTQNGGRTIKNLVFDRISVGNKSINGNINLIFIKTSKYREETSEREITIKYGSIWKVEKLDD